MRTISRAFLHIAMGALGAVACMAVAQADTVTFTLGSNPGQTYDGINVGPYPGSLTGSSATEFVCLDLTKGSTFGTSYPGTLSEPVGVAEDEAAFLTEYLLSQGAPSSDPNFVKQYEGPISFAIWQIMGTLGATPPDPAAAQFITLATNAYNGGLITPQFLSNFLVFTPSDGSVQRFMTVVGNTPVPEPGTLLLLGVGLLALAVYGRRWRQPLR